MENRGKTGELVVNAGVYQNKYGKKVTLAANDVFPPCPLKGAPIEWEKVDK
ncbi:MAG: hypothetical protein PWP27_368 [Clostridiales bacterium]|jgi:hypothetical protein|nr:hypothetical protein [Clostridiales bacterium]MDK2932558.1 hypothetical protein [Clostridiales bacterium]